MVFGAAARTPLNPNDPLGFFSTVADKMLRNTFSFGVTNIPVYVNGQFVYSPAVNRVLQLAANVYDASTNSFYPDVFRPTFLVTDENGSTNVYIDGYVLASTVTGPEDDQLALPVDISTLLNLPAGITYTNNVYGVPWIIGAKKYLPGFNQLSLINEFQVNRLLQIGRKSLPIGRWGPVYTNHMYLLSISNLMSTSFWNPYSNNYPTNYSGPLNLSAYVTDTVEMVLTNSDHPATPSVAFFSTNFVFIPPVWPGSEWSQPGDEGIPSANSFLVNTWTNTFIEPEIYKTGAKQFALPTDFDPWESNNYSCDPLPEFGLITTNWLRALILDNGHVVDYVQLCGPIDGTNISATLNDPDVTDGQIFLWATNAYEVGPIPSWGYANQILISRGGASPPASAQWNNPSLPSIPGLNTVTAGVDFLQSMFTPSSTFNYTVNGVTLTYTNTEPVVQAGYSAVRTSFVGYLYQVNDPLVHYLASDLNAGVGATWNDGLSLPNGIWAQNNGVVSVPFPSPPNNNDIPKSHYQPWGVAAPFALQGNAYNFSSAYNLIYKDPLVWGPDYWDFPTNLLSDLTDLGQVHRGTPWQTVYLKSYDVLNFLADSNILDQGTNTWVAWTGDGNAADAATMAPVNDRQLASVLISLLNTNNVAQLVSVNDPNTSDWLNLLNGLTVYSNSANFPVSFPLGVIPQTTFDTYQMASNSPQAEPIAAGIALARTTQPNHDFYSIGDILSVPELTVDSPWLNSTNVNQEKFGISDAAFEAIPSQLLLRLRPDSIGAMYVSNGGVNLQFSGSDALSYEVQQSSDLVHWTAVSTNIPVQGVFNVILPTAPGSSQQFYRSVLLP
jgi:hypothetical protein